MACDGEIATQEIESLELFIKENGIISDMDIKGLISQYVTELNNNNKTFFTSLFQEIQQANLSESDELTIASMAIKIIEADEKIEYSEIKFFKLIRSHLKVSDDIILQHNPNKEDYLAEDIKVDNYLEQYLGAITWNDIILRKNIDLL